MARNLTWCLKRTFVLTNHLNVHLRSTPILRACSYVKATFPEKPVPKVTDIDNIEPRDLVKFEEDTKANIKHATLNIAKIFKIPKTKAATIVEENPQLRHVMQKTLYKNFDILSQAGVTNEQLKDNIIFLARETDTLQLQMDIIQRMGLGVLDALPLLHLDVHELTKLRNKLEIDKNYIPNSNRILYLSEKLQENIETICRLMIYNPFLMTLSLEKIKNVTEFLLEIGVAPKNIRQDLFVYCLSLPVIKASMMRAKSLGVYPLKPWYTRCKETHWNVVEQKFANQNREVFDPEMSKEQYFCQIYNCSMDIANHVIQKDKRLLTMSRNKFVANAKLIKAEGYPLSELLVSRTSLLMSTNTLKKRFAEWNALGLKIRPRLWLFSLTHAIYNKRYNEACKAANKETNEEASKETNEEANKEANKIASES